HHADEQLGHNRCQVATLDIVIEGEVERGSGGGRSGDNHRRDSIPWANSSNSSRALLASSVASMALSRAVKSREITRRRGLCCWRFRGVLSCVLISRQD